ncbi:stalk domain-containing protein [Saccharibacillus sp. CPCC 101409]|uniref:stalk domain-containing protein n=1 Tax=Saccharibacillus sp. CPCC 101409 TaxID=3058041 RepID=UPI0026740BE8|nr:stalk domain-containing protein [Saccharibacillus sp. CPCC 101409]MDO3412092.1 stalk domain-containing protein [Saccharibacillus sp. CPCC 101409]
MNKHGGNTLKAGRKWMVAVLAGALVVQPIAVPGMDTLTGAHTASAAASVSSSKQGEEIVTSGAKLLTYKYSVSRSGSMAAGLADVIQIDLQNPYVKLDVMTGRGGKFTTLQTVSGMAKETGAVAGVNGDYFNTAAEGVPMGAQVSNGVLMTSPSELKGMYAFGVTKDRKPVIDQYDFTGGVTAEDGSALDLAGINQASYAPEPDGGYSHVNAMYIYTDAWGNEERPKNSATLPSEVLVENGVVTQYSSGKSLALKVPEGAYILRAHGTAATYMKAHLTVGSKVRTDYSLVSKTTGQKLDPSTLDVMIGGHTILVDGGKATSFSRSVDSIGGYRARTAVGYSQDNRYAYIVTVQDNGASSGMSLSELQSFMAGIGVWKGINLDGGGSTTMVTRPLGEEQAQLTFTTEYGGQTQRSVVNGLGVYTTAPEGKLKGFAVSGKTQLLIGETAAYSVKGYDTYYNPIAASDINPSWKSSNGNVVWNGTSFTAKKAGTSTLTATSGGVSTTQQVEVLGADSLSALNLGAAAAPLKAGTSVTLPATATLKSGGTVNIDPSALTWEFIGFKGSIKDGALNIVSVDAGAKAGYAIASYEGFKTMLTLASVQENSWEDFENVSYGISFTGSPAAVTGKAQLTQGTGSHSNSKVLRIDYDTAAGTGNKYAYANLNGSAGKALTSGASSLSLDVLGDSSYNWLRAEVVGADGKTVYVDLAKSLNFSGWKTLTVNLSQYGKIAYPAKLKRIYIVNLAEGQDERSAAGAVEIDNIKTVSAAGADSLGLTAGVSAKMTVGSRTLLLNGRSSTMDTGPLVRGGVTYLPVRYITDSFNGVSGWDSKTGAISVRRGSQLIVLNLNKKDYILNGTRKTSDAAPIIVANRTLVPARLVSEQLGLTVKWEQETKTVTIES